MVKRRIRGKRPSDGSDFPARALVPKAEHDRLKGIEAEKVSKVRRLNKAAMQVAEQAFAQNPEVCANQEEQAVDVPDEQAPHIT